MKKLMLVLVLLAGMLISAGGCATIMNGPNDMVNIHSAPPGAKFTISTNIRSSAVTGVSGYSDVVATGITPQNVLLARKTNLFGSRYSVKFSKNGYQNKTIPIKQTTSFWYFGNIIFGGFPGFIIDSITGAADDLHDVGVKLTPSK